MSDRSAFLARRRTGIGGSDVGAIVGVNPNKSALDVYLDKIGEVSDDEPSEVQLRGMYLEPIVKSLYFERSGRTMKPARFRRHYKHKWMIGHPDALIRGIDEPIVGDDFPGILECKTMGFHVLRQAAERGISKQYQLQGQHYMALCNHNWMAFALLHPDSFRYAVVNLEADPTVQAQIVEVCEDFWYNHVVPRKPPEEKPPEWSIELPAVEGMIVDRHDPEWRYSMEQDVEFKAMRDEVTALYEANRTIVKELCGRHGVFEGAGARAYFKQQPGSLKALSGKEMLALGLIDPDKLAQWAVDTNQDLPGTLALLQAAAKDLRVDMEKLTKRGKPFETLRIYHILDES